MNLPSSEKMSNVKLYEDALLSLDSISFDEYIEKSMISRKFSNQEQEIVKDIKRRIKNRESARKSRKIKRNKLDVLEGKVKDLKEENNNLKMEVSHLRIENNQLRNEVVRLNSPSYSYYSNIKEDPHISSQSKGVTTQSVVFFVILFSFGLLWNLDTNAIISSFGSKSNKDYFMSNVFQAEDPELSKLFNDYEGYSEEMINNYKNLNEKSKPRIKDVETCC